MATSSITKNFVISGQTQVLQYQVGGMVTFVEAEKNEKILSYYTDYSYKRFAI